MYEIVLIDSSSIHVRTTVFLAIVLVFDPFDPSGSFLPIHNAGTFVSHLWIIDDPQTWGLSQGCQEKLKLHVIMTVSTTDQILIVSYNSCLMKFL